MSETETSSLHHVRRKLRLIAIVAAAERAGLAPLPTRQLHAVSYFADALAPVWGLRILDARLLKRREGPTSPLVQRDLDRLVGEGVVDVSSVRHSVDGEGLWRLDAAYSLNRTLADPILATADSFADFALELDYLREVVFALSSLGAVGIADASAADASYGDELVDHGGMVNIAGGSSGANPTTQVAIRFGELMQPDIALSDSEKVHLYVRELYRRLASHD
jgi:hypothetical protein